MYRLIFLSSLLFITGNLFSQEIFWIDQKDYDGDNYYTSAEEITALDSHRFVLNTNWSNGKWGYQTHQGGSLTALYEGIENISDFFSFYSTSTRGYPSVYAAYHPYKYTGTSWGQGFTDVHSSKFKYVDLLANEEKQFSFEGALLSYNVNKIDDSFYALLAPMQLYRPSGAINYSGIYNDTIYLLRFSNPNSPADTLGVFRQPVKPGYNYEKYLAYVKIDLAANQMKLYRKDTLIEYDLNQIFPTKIEAINTSGNDYLLGRHWWTGHKPKPYSLIHYQDSLNPQKVILYLVKNRLNAGFSVDQDTLYRTVLSNINEPMLYGGGSTYHVDANENLYYSLTQKAPAPFKGHHSVLYKFDRLGEMIWKEAFFTDSTSSKISSIDKSEDGTLYLAGTVYGPGMVYYQNVPWHPFVVKLGKSHPANLENTPPNDINIYPNPAANSISITSLNPIQSVRVVNSYGQVISELDFNQTKYLQLNTTILESGHYILNIQLSNGSLKTERVIIAR